MGRADVCSGSWPACAVPCTTADGCDARWYAGATRCPFAASATTPVCCAQIYAQLSSSGRMPQLGSRAWVASVSQHASGGAGDAQLGLLSLCQAPLLLTPEAKALILQV